MGNPGVDNPKRGPVAIVDTGRDCVVWRPAHIPALSGAGSGACQPQLACIPNSNLVGRTAAYYDWIRNVASPHRSTRYTRVQIAQYRALRAAGGTRGGCGGRLRDS